MRFDENEYREEFIKKHRGELRGAPGDLLTRYAITLPATDGEIAAQVREVRKYWNKIYSRMSSEGQVARLCRTEDERLKLEHGASMETLAWWQARQTDAQRAAKESIAVMTDDLRRRFGTLGVVSPQVLSQFAATLSLSAAQTKRATDKAGVTVIPDVTLPAKAPIGNFSHLAKAMAECAVPSVPELLHPGAGKFRLVERYECLADPHKRLDAVAVQEQRAAADKRGISGTEDARRKALAILDQAVRNGTDLRDIALYQMVVIAREAVPVSADLAARELRKAGLEDRDAAIVAVLVAEQDSPGAGSKVPDLLAGGRLREARAAAMTLPPAGEVRADALKQVDQAQRALDDLIMAARAAVAAADEARAETLLRDAEKISAEDAATALAAVPLPPPGSARAAADGGVIRLSWGAAPGHGADTVYVVRRGLGALVPAAPSEGEPVYRDRGDSCTDAGAPVARTVRYAVFATADGRPNSRPAPVTVSVLLPPVTGLRSAVSGSTAALSWSAHPSAEVRVTRTSPGGAPVPVPVVGRGCQVTGLEEGVPHYFEVTAVYRGPGGAELPSAPETVRVTPRAPAQPVTTLRARPVVVNGVIRVQISWIAADSADVKVIRADREPAIPLGSIVTPAAMAAIGQEVTGPPAAVPGRTGFEASLSPGVHRLVPFTEGGTGMVIGKAVGVAVTDPVRHLSYTAFADYATLSWEWPDNSGVTEVHWRLDGEEDVTLVDIGRYRKDGGFKVPLGNGPCHVEVRAVISAAGKSYTSPPSSVEIPDVVGPLIPYDVSTIGVSVGPFGGRAKRVVFTAERPCSGTRVVMVTRAGPVLPADASDGERILDEVLSLQPGVSAEFAPVVPGWIKKPRCSRCFVLSGPGRLIDPPVARLKET
jgi:hypothetical protein